MHSVELLAAGIVFGLFISLIRGGTAPCGTPGYNTVNFYANPGETCSADYTYCSGPGASTTTAQNCYGAGADASGYIATVVLRFSPTGYNATTGGCVDRRTIPACANEPKPFGMFSFVTGTSNYQITPLKAGYAILTNISVLPTETMMKCTVYCFALPNCYSFNYRPKNQTCQLMNFVLNMTNAGTDFGGASGDTGSKTYNRIL